MKRADLLAAAAIALAVTLTLHLAARSEGYSRDETFYFRAAEQHVAYYEEALAGLLSGRPFTFARRDVIDRHFEYNHEHPPLMKTLFGFSWRLLHRCECPQRHRTLAPLSRGEAMRLPANLLAGLLCAAVYLFGTRAFGRRAGLLAAGLTVLAPRHFLHAELACFDAPIAAMIFLTTWAYYEAQRSGSRRWLVAAGVLAGLALSTKHNAFFLPFVLLVHSLWVRRRLLREGKPMRLVFAPWIPYMAALAVPVYLASWPWLWHDTVRRFGEYVGFHLHHVYYNIEYLGVNYNRPPFPWHYAPVTTLLTAPVTTLALALAGALTLPRDRDGDATGGAAGLLLALGFLWPILLIMKPGTPIFGAEKHWLPAIPFLALLAGSGFERLWDLGARPAPPALGWTLAALLLVPPALEVRRSHPYGLSHYNALAGGPAGAADLGMNRQFWGYSARGVFPYLNRHAPFHAAVYFHDAIPEPSVMDGLLRRDLRDTGLEEPGVRASDIALVVIEQHFNKYEYWIWDAYGTTRPDFVLTHEGVPLVTVYRRPQK